MKTDTHTAPRSLAGLTDVTIATDSGYKIVEGVTLTVGPGEILGLVGESGAGKSSVALSLLGYVQPGAHFESGVMLMGDSSFELGADRSIDKLRGTKVAYVPQESGVSLNPATRVGRALALMRSTHGMSSTPREIEELLESVSLPSSETFQQRFPHQLSGGQQQRLSLALGIACNPEVLVLDEITTGLDVVTQEAILKLVTSLARANKIGIVYITHDLAVVSQIADRIAVLYAGEVVEWGPTADVLRLPRHPYTKALIEAAPNHRRPSHVVPLRGIAPSLGVRPAGCRFAPRCELATERCTAEKPSLDDCGEQHKVRCFHSDRVGPILEARARATQVSDGASEVLLSVERLSASHKSHHGRITVAREISFGIREGQCLALVGESGSGKTTIARSIVGLHRIDSGTIRLAGEVISDMIRQRSVAQRRDLQFIFQNPRAALNPKQTIAEIVSRPLRTLRSMRGKVLEAEARSLLDEVRLPGSTAGKYPSELSGGERQRVGIARALAASPRVLVCDEVTSALDVSVQAAVLELLRELSDSRGLGMLMITHDLGVVASIAHEVLVLKDGEICEHGDVRQVLTLPRQEYTMRLLEAAPSLHQDWTGTPGQPKLA
ncbi:ABC transporter ATP-binding protein [Agromyces sp. NPDC058484]|uniref:ABC transporter ATP-binding protein n=1 Tax=Agromyces sp. NPDC058484 TaxID=3346524 RepID=UPI0036523FDB